MQSPWSDGLFAKAAREYTNAWDGFEVNGVKLREEAGLKAAHLWAERVQTPVESARILNYIIIHPQDLTVLQQAKDLLASLKPTLEQIYSDILKAGQDPLAQGQMDDALKALTIAAQAKPRSQEVHLSLARLYTMKKDLQSAIVEASLAVKAGTIDIDASMKTHRSKLRGIYR